MRVRQVLGQYSQIVGRSDLLLTMTRSQARIVNRQMNNQVLPFPFEAPPMESFLYWHANVDEDPASRWLRGQVLASIAETTGQPLTTMNDHF